MVSIHSGELAPNTEARQCGPSPTCAMADATSATSRPASCIDQQEGDWQQAALGNAEGQPWQSHRRPSAGPPPARLQRHVDQFAGLTGSAAMCAEHLFSQSQKQTADVAWQTGSHTWQLYAVQLPLRSQAL